MAESKFGADRAMMAEAARQRGCDLRKRRERDDAKQNRDSDS